MDPQTAYAMQQWNQMRNQQAGIRPDRRPEPMANWPMLAQYRQMVNQTLLNNPNFGYINPDMIMRLMQKESNWDPGMVSESTATGLTQVKPETADEMVKKKRAWGYEDLRNPEDSIRLGATYLDYLKRRYGGGWRDTLQRYRLGPAAYRRGARDKAYADYILGKEE